MNKVKLLRYGSGALVILMVFILQTTALQNFSIRGIVPNLIIVTTISFALLRGRIDGAIVGALLGLLQDIFYGGVVGFYGAIFMYIGFFTGFLYMNFYKDSILIPIGVIASADVLVNLITYFFTFLFRGQLKFYVYLGQIIIPELIYTILIGFLFYRLFYMVNRTIEQVEWSKEYEE